MTDEHASLAFAFEVRKRLRERAMRSLRKRPPSFFGVQIEKDASAPVYRSRVALVE